MAPLASYHQTCVPFIECMVVVPASIPDISFEVPSVDCC